MALSDRVTGTPLQRIASRVEAETGLTFRQPGTRAFELAVEERRVARGCANTDAYADVLARDRRGDEVEQLAERLVVRETSLFRQPLQFETLRLHVLPAWDAALPSGEPLRVWSAGTATGEEAYSAAATALATFAGRRPVEVLATDISPQALRGVQRAIYTPRGQPVPGLYQGWFARVEGGLQPVAAVRSLVRPRHHNLAAVPFALPEGVRPGSQHVVFCRNVLIYFAPATVRRVLEGLHAALAPGGYLFVGHAEALFEAVQDLFDPATLPGGSLYRKLPVAAPLTQPLAPPRGAVPARAFEDLLAAARRLADEEQLDAALAAAREAAAADPSQPAAWELLGLLASRRGQAALALAALREATRLAPSAPLAWVYLAGALRTSGEHAAAAHAYQEALHLLERLPPHALVGEFAAGHLARLCRERIAASSDER